MTARGKFTPNPVPLVVSITAGRTSPPTCLITWDVKELKITCSQVRDLAAAMMAAAARAEAEAAVVATLRRAHVGDQGVGVFVADMRAHYDPRILGTKDALTLVPGVSLFDGTPFVHANMSPYEPSRWSPEELRDTAAEWTQVAEAAERDSILTYALAEATDLTKQDIERLFGVMRDVRPDGSVNT